MASLGKIFLVCGLIIAGIGLLFMLSDRISWIGKLPGDIVIKREKVTIYFPLVTCVVISVVLSLLFWLFRR